MAPRIMVPRITARRITARRASLLQVMKLRVRTRRPRQSGRTVIRSRLNWGWRSSSRAPYSILRFRPSGNTPHCRSVIHLLKFGESTRLPGGPLESISLDRTLSFDVRLPGPRNLAQTMLRLIPAAGSWTLANCGGPYLALVLQSRKHRATVCGVDASFSPARIIPVKEAALPEAPRTEKRLRSGPKLSLGRLEAHRARQRKISCPNKALAYLAEVAGTPDRR
jgi:hypothetical protein